MSKNGKFEFLTFPDLKIIIKVRKGQREEISYENERYNNSGDNKNAG